MNAKKAKTDYKDESSMTINNEKATMMAKISHNEDAGTIKITYTLTTRHLSFNDDVAAQVESELAKFHKKVYADALQIRKQWIEDQNKIEGAAKIPFPGMEEEEVDDDLPFGDIGEPAVDDEGPKTPVKRGRGSRMKVK